MDIKQYIKKTIEARDKNNADYMKNIKKSNNPYSFIYFLFGSRLANERIIEKYQDKIIASMECDFGWAFIIKGKVGYFCFTLLNDVCGLQYGNRLARWSDNCWFESKGETFERRFLQEYGDKFTFKDDDEYSRFMNKLALRRLK